jgi:hypothetical protein
MALADLKGAIGRSLNGDFDHRLTQHMVTLLRIVKCGGSVMPAIDRANCRKTSLIDSVLTIGQTWCNPDVSVTTPFPMRFPSMLSLVFRLTLGTSNDKE